MSQAATSQPNPDDVIHHESPRSRRDNAATGPMQPNLSSMIDVIFLLLIYFVVTANFTVGEGVITAKLPQAEEGSAASPPPDKPLNIVVSSAGQYQYNITIEGMSQAPRNFTELATLLERLQLNPSNPGGSYKDDNPVMIKPDGTVRWQHVVNAFNAAIKARYRNVSFAKPTDGG